MMAVRRSRNDHNPPGSGYRGTGRPDARGRRRLGLLVALLAVSCSFALPAAPAFGEGSAEMNTGPGGLVRQTLLVNGRPGGVYPVLYVYAQAGETVQLGSSAMGLAGGQDNILVYAPGTDLVGKELPEDPVFGTAIFDCNTDDPGTGRIDTRAKEVAGPAPSPGGYTPCTFTPTTTGIYPVIMLPFDAETVVPGSGGVRGTVDAPVVDATQLWTINAWDITVRAGGADQPGRVFSNTYVLGTGSGTGSSSGAEVFVYTKTGYEYEVNLTDQAGINWQLFSDDVGVLDALTGERTFASYIASTGGGAGVLGPFDRRYPLFVSRPDPLAISGAGGLGQTLGYSTTPIAPAAQPLANAGFTGSGGQAGATNRGSGGTIAFTSPSQMAGLGYTIEIDLNRNGTFGDGTDLVDDTNDLAATGSNGFTWSGLDAAGNAPACGDYPYQIRSTLSEIHFAMADVENSGGTTIERLSLPTDPDLGDPFAASYNDIDPFQNLDTTNNPVDAVTDGDSSVAGFHGWSANSGDEDWIDTWARLPEVQTTGTLQVLCPAPPPPPPVYDLQINKSSSDRRVRLGETFTYTLKVRNNGPDAAPAGGVVRDTVPEQFQVLGVTGEGGAQCGRDGREVRCTLPAMASGSELEVQVRVRAIESGGTRNTAFVDPPPDPRCVLASCDSVPPNNKDPEPVTVVEMKLGLTKQVSKRVLRAGQTTVYTIRVSNPYDVAIRNVRTCDRLPAGLVYVSAKPKATLSGGQHCWTVKRLAAGASKTYRVTVRALRGTSGRKVNIATATSPDAKKAQAKRAVRVNAGQVLPDRVTG